MQLSQVPYLESTTTWKQRPFGSVLFQRGSTQKVYLNATATHMLSLIDGIHTGEEIAAELAKIYEIPPERAHTDVRQLFDRLSAMGLLTCDPERGKAADADEVSPPLGSISLALTHRCNLRCTYCHIPLEERADAELTTGEWIETIRQIGPFKLMEVILTGGEPLLRKDLWDIVDAVNSMNVNVVICTNGLLLDEAFIECAQSAKIVKIQIGLDGATRETHEALRGEGTFDRTWQSIRLAQKYGLPVEILCTVTRRNLTEFEQVVRMAREHGLPVSINEYLPLGPSRERRDELELTAEHLFRLRSRITTLSLAGVLLQKADEEHTFKKHVVSSVQTMWFRKVYNCLGRDGGAHILPNGDMLICPMLNWPELVGGNVRRTPLREIWETSPAFQRIRQTMVDGYATCRTCANRYLCGGTCRAITWAETGSLEGTPDTSRCLWEQVYYARLSRVQFDSTEPFQTNLERAGLLQ